MPSVRIRLALVVCAVSLSLTACSKSEPNSAPDIPKSEAAHQQANKPDAEDYIVVDPVIDAAMAAYDNWRHEILTGEGPLGEDWQKDIRQRWQRAQAESDPFLKELGERTVLDQFPRLAQVWDKRTRTRINQLKGLQLDEFQLGVFGTLLIDGMAQTDASNLAWLKDIYEVRGEWFPISEVGERGASNALLIIQHGTNEPFLMARVVADMETLYHEGEASGSDFALLFDRVQMMAGQPQRYGSQFSCEDGKLVPHEIADAFELDARRKDVGLQPMEEYVKLLGDLSC